MESALVDKVQDTLKAIDWGTKNQTKFLPSEWTRDIKSGMATLGFNENYSVWASGVEERDSGGNARIVNQEWLFDLTWIEYEGRGPTRKMKSLPLVLESELPTDKARKEQEVLDDFEKLIVARAGLKVMIFQVDQTAEATDRFDKLVSHINSYRAVIPDGEYLLASIIWQEGRFEFFHLPPEEMRRTA